jgi:hypothetical protein
MHSKLTLGIVGNANNLHHPHNETDFIMGDADAGSAQILLKAAQTPRPIDDDILNEQIEAERCKRYNLQYTNRKERRRIFWGALIADDSWHAISTIAIETHGIFHTAAFVESNRTQMLYPRNMRFSPGSENKRALVESKMFGPNTIVTVDYYINESKWPDQLGREHDQRSLIIKRWKENGMTPHDLGLLSDADETFSRDFLRALQICDVPEFDSKYHGNCYNPRVRAPSLHYEGSPLCVQKKRWNHPDVIIGECIETIGDSTKHPSVGKRAWEGIGWRDDGWAYTTQYSALPRNTTHYPLWNAADFRRGNGGGVLLGAGFHLHNFFPSISSVRWKYETYGHPHLNAEAMHLGSIDGDLNFMVNCVLNRTDDGSLHKLDGSTNITSMPLAFQIPGYTQRRHSEIREEILRDEKELKEKAEAAERRYEEMRAKYFAKQAKAKNATEGEDTQQ